MLYKQSMTNSQLLIPIPSTNNTFPNRHVVTHPRNHIQRNTCIDIVNTTLFSSKPNKF